MSDFVDMKNAKNLVIQHAFFPLHEFFSLEST